MYMDSTATGQIKLRVLCEFAFFDILFATPNQVYSQWIGRPHFGWGVQFVAVQIFCEIVKVKGVLMRPFCLKQLCVLTNLFIYLFMPCILFLLFDLVLTAYYYLVPIMFGGPYGCSSTLQVLISSWTVFQIWFKHTFLIRSINIHFFFQKPIWT